MPPRRRHERLEVLGSNAQMHLRWDVERDIVSFAVVAMANVDGAWRAVELYDCSHAGHNDRHRYSRDGVKGDARLFHDGTAAEAFRAAVALIRRDHERMIDRWQR